ncbi:Gfo/Idh/MocA family protein [Alsobacter sp. R-9]
MSHGAAAGRGLGIGIIGTGFMGRSHALAYRAAAGVIPGLPHPRLAVVADVDGGAAEAARTQMGFARATTDWRDLVADPAVDVVAITTPNVLHREMALAAVAAGKHVHCEKPLAPTAADARVMTEAAEAAGVVTQVGFNYLKNPLLAMARDMIAAGEIGTVTSFRAIHAEGFMSDPDVPHSWRLDPAGGPGALGDIGSHAIALGRFLLGPVESVFADLETVVKDRPVTRGARERRPVLVDDIARLTVRFARGCRGSIEANWVATGRTMQLAFDIHGSRGAISFTQERFNELLVHRAGGDARQQGYVRVEAGPQHAPYGHFCVAPGHQLGFNDLKTIEVADFLAAIAGGPRKGPDFREALAVQQVIDAALVSSAGQRWVAVEG